MGVLFDAFSYRVNKTPDGFYYDRWHGHVFPEISMPENCISWIGLFLHF